MSLKPQELALAPVPAVRHYYVDESGDPNLFTQICATKESNGSIISIRRRSALRRLGFLVISHQIVQNYEHNVHFASRGHTDRTASLRAALIAVQKKTKARLNPGSTGSMKIFDATTPFKTVNLQAADYCLWALQRFYTLKQEKYLKMIWPSVSMIYEMDSKIGKKHGKIFTKKKHPFGCLKNAEDIGSK